MTTPMCRACGAPLVHTLVDLGTQPLANSFIEPGTEGQEKRYPLHARGCGVCALVQVDDVVPPSEIFSEYAYFSSYSTSWVEHARRFAEEMTTRYGLGPTSLVAEVASNDGYLLQHFIAAGVPVLGVEPAANIAEVALSNGVPTEISFFGESTATELAGRGQHADLVVANNVLAHVPDINDFVAGLAVFLAPGGTLSIEAPHLLRLVAGLQFDTIYHEHYSYLSVLSVRRILATHGLRLHDVRELETHGGSLRYLAVHDADPRPTEPAVERVAEAERAAGLDRPETFTGFAARVERCRDGLLEFLESNRAAGRRVAAYGAAAKGNTLLNYAGVDTGLIDFVVDRNPHKQGLLMPGSHLPIVDPDVLATVRPERVLVLPWNLRAELIGQLTEVTVWGGQLVVAIPEIEVVV